MASLIKILDNAKFLSKTVFGDVSPNPTYQLGSSLASVNEGSSVVFTLSTTNVSDGTLVPYVITGVSLADLASGALTGVFTVSNNIATASITLAADALTEGSETMTVSLSSGVASASVVVNDTSRTPTYAIGRSLSAVNEGSSVVFTLSTTNVSNGTVLPYTISGISANDVTTGSLTGSFTVSNNLATATITMSADQLTEGAETATLTLNNAAASNFVVVNDTSVFTPATISGLQLWLDAADSSTLFDAITGGNLVTTEGAAVARWADKSGNNRHAIQSVVNNRPTKSGSSLSFNGTTSFFDTISGLAVSMGTRCVGTFVIKTTGRGVGLFSTERSSSFSNTSVGHGYIEVTNTGTMNYLAGTRDNPPYTYTLNGSVSANTVSSNFYAVAVTVPNNTGVVNVTTTGTMSANCCVNGAFQTLTNSSYATKLGSGGVILTDPEIGRYRNYNFGSSFFNGGISKILFYNRLLANTEITSLYQIL